MVYTFCKSVALTIALLLTLIVNSICQTKDSVGINAEGIGLISLGNDSAAIEPMILKAKNNMVSGNYSDAIAIFQQLTKKGKPKKYRIEAFTSLSRIYEALGEYNLAIESHLEAAELVQDSMLLMKMNIRIANSFWQLGDYESALHSINDAILYFTSKKDSFWLSTSYGMRAVVFKSQKRIKEALEQDFLAYHLIKDLCVSENCVGAQQASSNNCAKYLNLNNLADTYLLLGNTDSALYYLDKTKSDFSKLPENLKATILTTYGEIYLKKKAYREATFYLKAGEKIAEKFQFTYIMKAIYKNFAQMYSSKREYHIAFEYQQKYIQAFEAMHSKDNIHKINYIQTKYENENKENELLIQKDQLKLQNLQLLKITSQRGWITGLSIATIIIVALIIWNLNSRQKFLKQTIIANERGLELSILDSSLKGQELAREQIAKELHDSVVSELMILNMNLKGNVHKTDETGHDETVKNIYHVGEIAQRLREISHSLMPVRLKELGLTGSIKLFIEKIVSPYCNFTFQVYGSVSSMGESSERIILLIIQELVQNIIKHSHATIAIIQLDYYENILSITVEDNGVGFDLNSRKEGIGINNIRQNVKILGGTFDLRSDSNKGTTVLIEIAINKNI